jgi:hypothetical protein
MAAASMPTSPVPYGAKAPAERQGACPGGFCDGVVRITSDKNALVEFLTWELPHFFAFFFLKRRRPSFQKTFL